MATTGFPHCRYTTRAPPHTHCVLLSCQGLCQFSSLYVYRQHSSYTVSRVSCQACVRFPHCRYTTSTPFPHTHCIVVMSGSLSGFLTVDTPPGPLPHRVSCVMSGVCRFSSLYLHRQHPLPTPCLVCHIAEHGPHLKRGYARFLEGRIST